MTKYLKKRIVSARLLGDNIFNFVFLPEKEINDFYLPIIQKVIYLIIILAFDGSINFPEDQIISNVNIILEQESCPIHKKKKDLRNYFDQRYPNRKRKQKKTELCPFEGFLQKVILKSTVI